MAKQTMSGLGQTEITKLTTTTAPLLVVLGMPALAAAAALRAVAGAGRRGAPSLGTAGALEATLGGFSRGAVLALVLGALIAVTEQRHGTLAGSLLRSPRRSRLAIAKAFTAGALATTAGVMALALVAAVALVGGVLAAPLDSPAGPVSSWPTARCVGLLLAFPVYGLLGLAVGLAFGRFAAPALLLPAAWALVLEDLVLGSLAPHVPPWALTRLADAAARAADVHPLLPAGQACALLAAWGVAAVAAGTWWLARADIS